MTKINVLFTLILLMSSYTFSQSATEYCIPAIGMEWKYETRILDSLQNPLPTLKPIYTYQKLLGISSNSSNTVNAFVSARVDGDIAPQYLDTTFIKTFPDPFSQYFNVAKVLGNMLPDTFDVSPFDSLSGWYRIMNFDGVVSLPDTLLRFDTTITYDSLSFPVQIVYTTTKYNEKSITVSAETLSALPFVTRLQANILYEVPLYGKISIPLVVLSDTIFIAKGKWIVKEVMPSTTFPAPSKFSTLLPKEIPVVTIFGSSKELLSMTLTSVDDEKYFFPYCTLEQNFPNPFNPETIISYTLASNTFVSVAVYDILGKEVAQIVREEQSAGVHTFRFNALHYNLSSGIYFYTVRTDKFIQTRKMIIQK